MRLSGTWISGMNKTREISATPRLVNRTYIRDRGLYRLTFMHVWDCTIALQVDKEPDMVHYGCFIPREELREECIWRVKLGMPGARSRNTECHKPYAMIVVANDLHSSNRLLILYIIHELKGHLECFTLKPYTVDAPYATGKANSSVALFELHKHGQIRSPQPF